MRLLSPEFLQSYADQPEHMNQLGSFVFYRTYSRWLPVEERRETWKEAITRAVEYNVSQQIKQFERNKFDVPYTTIQGEAEALFDNIYNLRQFLSGRTHWVGGAEGGVADKFPLANFNCSFINVEKWEDMAELFYLLLVGTGVGFKSTQINAAKMQPLRTDFELVHEEYKPVLPHERLEYTELQHMQNGYAIMYVGDSKEGWVDALRKYIHIMTYKEYTDIHTLKVSYNSVRPNGERLNTFGGTASGHEPLQEMFESIYKLIQGTLHHSIPQPTQVDENHVRLRPVHLLDMGNLIGNNVVVGGVRRTAEIFLADHDDWESILAKYGINGIWDDYNEFGEVIRPASDKHQEVIDALNRVTVVPDWMYDLEMNNDKARNLPHRRMSNNSVAFESKPTREYINTLFIIMQNEGEPGFVNLEEARRRRPNAEGLNPCAEILLDSKEVCNLTTINVAAFVHQNTDGAYYLDLNGLTAAQALSTRAGIRMTLLDLELPEWDVVQKRDRLIGTSLTGWQDAMGLLDWDEEQRNQLEQYLSDIVMQESSAYCHVLRIPTPLLDTTVKPEGTLSQVAGGVSSGLHVAHAPYFIRRIRINATDPLAKVAQELNWNVNPEVGQTWLDAKTLVVDFPIKSTSTRFREDQSVDDQFDTYYSFQENYTRHNSSNTISVRPDEWGRAEERVYENWDNFIGVSFLAYNGGSYDLAPYEEITKERYEELVSTMREFDPTKLSRWETNGLSELTDESCADGACAPR